MKHPPLTASLIEAFAGTFLSPMYDNAQPTPEFHRTCWELYCSTAELTAVAAPREHAKSTALTHDYGLATALFRVEDYILIVSATEELAIGHLGDIAKELRENEDIQREFDVSILPTDSKTDIIVKFLDGHECRFIAKGSGQKMRGMKWKGKRPGLIICHEKGTLINADGKNMLVEDHPTARLQESTGFCLKVHGLPYEEVVTKEHRYWTRRIKQIKRQVTKDGQKIKYTDYEKITGWRETKDITSRTYLPGGYVSDWIGMPIDYTNEAPQSFLGLEDDPDFWWALGLWWGDGTTAPSNNNITWFIADGDRVTSLRLERFLRAHNFHYSGYQRQGCYSLTITNSALADWLKTWKFGNSQKVAPSWILRVHPAFQAELLKGYIAADGFLDFEYQQIRLTSVCYEGLMQVRAILARIGIAASIRLGIGPGKSVIEGREVNTQQKYDLRFRDGASKLGFNIRDQDRYELSPVFIEDGYLWSQVKSKEASGVRTFVPIQTETHTYLTGFGLSHNCDDLEEDEQVENIDRRRKFRKWFYRALLPCRRRGGKVRMHGTILHEDSILARVLRPKTTAWKGLLFRAHASFDDFSNALWPEQFPESRLRAIRQTFIEDGDAAGYSQEYLNDPFDNSEAYLRKDDFIPMSEDDYEVDKRICVGCDFAVSRSDRANRTSFTVGGQDVNHRLHVVDQFKGRWDTLEWIEVLFDIQSKWQPEVFFVEDGVIWKSVAPIVYKEMMRRGNGHWLNIQPINPTRDKATRGRDYQKMMRAGACRFDKKAGWYEDFEQENLRFTGNSDATLDDQFDSMALLAKGFNTLVDVEEEDFESEETIEMSRLDPRVSTGRSAVTGY